MIQRLAFAKSTDPVGLFIQDPKKAAQPAFLISATALARQVEMAIVPAEQKNSGETSCDTYSQSQLSR
ncbi:MAG: hypothetical protein ABI740_05630 [Alphaproteobacteria bacterium]